MAYPKEQSRHWLIRRVIDVGMPRVQVPGKVSESGWSVWLIVNMHPHICARIYVSSDYFLLQSCYMYILASRGESGDPFAVILLVSRMFPSAQISYC
jgi:hypothetical protein